MTESNQKTILMTAFEPSGDALGAAAARGIYELEPTARIVGLGGNEMEQAGVELLAHTTNEAAMGLGAVSEILRIKRLVDMVEMWIEKNEPDVAVAVDSPAANFPVCKVARKHGRRIVHLAAPQLWAWAPWRIRKMRRLTDHVMCLLPFEPEWFSSRGVKATFIGHPAMTHHAIDEIALPEGSPRIVLLPGSRAREIAANLPMQQEILRRICHEHQGTDAVIACRGEDVDRVSPSAHGLQIVAGHLPSALAWADLALTVSGTVTLHVMRHATPMVGMYRVGPISRLGAAMLLQSPHRLLPNLIAGKRIVPEFVPCGNSATVIADAALDMLSDEKILAAFTKSLRDEASRYEGYDPSALAANIILDEASRNLLRISYFRF